MLANACSTAGEKMLPIKWWNMILTDLVLDYNVVVGGRGDVSRTHAQIHAGLTGKTTLKTLIRIGSRQLTQICRYLR